MSEQKQLGPLPFEDKIKAKIQDTLIDLLSQEEIEEHIKNNVSNFFTKVSVDATTLIPTHYSNQKIMVSTFDRIIQTMICEYTKEKFEEFKKSEEFVQTYDQKMKGIFSLTVKEMFAENGDKILFGMFAQMMQQSMQYAFSSSGIKVPNFPVFNPLQ